MGCKKGKCHRQALLAQFCYEHQKLECCMRKIRKNAEELCKILDSMPPKKERKRRIKIIKKLIKFFLTFSLGFHIIVFALRNSQCKIL